MATTPTDGVFYFIFALGCEDQLNSRWHSSRRSAGSRNVTHGEAGSFDFARQAQCAIKKRMQFTSSQQWSPANVELFQAVAKITILVLLKLIIKYYIRGYLKAHIASKAFFELIELSSKALTIAIAKCAIKWALYPALRTASKTFLIASLKSIVKPFTSPLTKSPKGVSLDLSASCVRFVLNLSFKVLIKTIALEMLVVVFENEATQMPLHQLMARVTLILVVKMSAKRICKLGKQKTFPREKENDDLGDISAAPVDKMLMFAIKKLVTKLVKIPLIKMLL